MRVKLFILGSVVTPFKRFSDKLSANYIFLKFFGYSGDIRSYENIVSQLHFPSCLFSKISPKSSCRFLRSVLGKSFLQHQIRVGDSHILCFHEIECELSHFTWLKRGKECNLAVSVHVVIRAIQMENSPSSMKSIFSVNSSKNC